VRAPVGGGTLSNSKAQAGREAKAHGRARSGDASARTLPGPTKRERRTLGAGASARERVAFGTPWAIGV